MIQNNFGLTRGKYDATIIDIIESIYERLT